MRAWLRSVLLLIVCSSLSPPLVATPAAVQDLQYGEVLFHFYQEDYFNSIVRLQIAQQQERLPHHADEAELLLGGLDLSYGLRNAADDIFQRLLTEDTTREEVRNRAWYYLAKISYQRGDTARAIKALAQVQGKMSATARGDAAHLYSLALLQLGRNEEAVSVLQEARANAAWTPYLTYNLGVAQMRSNRLAAGAEQLERVGELNGRSEELRLLRDKANLALGYSYLQQGAADKSRQALERVRLAGPLSNKALLGTGWADAEVEAFGRALVPWTELVSRNVTDPAVQEALLAAPYAMAKLDLHGRAVESYQQSIATLYEERHKLDESINAIRGGELIKALQGQFPGTGNGWLQTLAMVSGSPALRYQVQLMAAHDFQEAVKNYRDLQALRENLDTWAASMEAYDDMLATRAVRYGNYRPAAAAALRSDTLARLEQRHDTLADTLAATEAGGDPVGLANAEESRQWQRLTDIKARLNALPDSPEVDVLRVKQRRLQGVLLWQLNADYKARLWQAKQQLRGLEDLIGQGRAGHDALAYTAFDVPIRFGGFGERIATQKQVIRELQARTLATQLAQGAQLEQLAVYELEQQKQRVESYLVQARFALAQTFDSALNTVAEPGGGAQ
jgi:hypothetical protein